jgi:hypothetical protein
MQNVTIDFRWAEGQFDRLPALAKELVDRPVAVIAALGGSGTAAKAATTTIPRFWNLGRPSCERFGRQPQPARRQHHRCHFSDGRPWSKAGEFDNARDSPLDGVILIFEVMSQNLGKLRPSLCPSLCSQGRSCCERE